MQEYIDAKRNILLYQKIWGKDSLGDVRTVQVHIHNLRSKIEPDPAKPVYLCNCLLYTSQAQRARKRGEPEDYPLAVLFS